jgi:hypothetical protein
MQYNRSKFLSYVYKLTKLRIGYHYQYMCAADYMRIVNSCQGFFWPDFIAEIRLCSQSQKVYFFPKMWQKIPNFQKKKKNFFFFFR